MAGTKFMFSTGIENSYPTILLPDGRTKRVDEMEKCNHYNRWKEDFQLVKDLGIEFLRYGPQYFSVHRGPGSYDWSFIEEALAELKRLHITPIIDLCHFGVPDWLGNFQNPDFPFYFAEYAKAFARKFPDLHLYTPINEIFITAMFSAQYGWWNERLQSDRAFVTALKHLCRGNVMAMQNILAVQPEATFIQSESSEYFHAMDPAALPRARFLNQKRFLSLDLTYGYPLNVTMYEYLLSNGMTRYEYDWFTQNQVKAKCIMGNDYYVTNEHLVFPDGHTQAAGEIFGYYVITSQYYRRYKLPIMHTETNIRMPACKEWLLKQWANVHRLKNDGIPVIGFTWYSLTHQVDWDSALRDDAGNVNELGLYDLDRKIMPVGEAYRTLIDQWKQILNDESYGLTFDNW
jgi:beta-glucosidase/6-phospho-beta-glucosidase/beta-galactosidase